MKIPKTSFSQWGLTAKLAALFILFGFVPMAVIGLIAYKASLTIEGTAGTRFQNVAEGVADKIDRNLFERYGDVQAFGINRVIDQKATWYHTEEQSNPIIEVMNQYIDTYDLYYLTILVDLDGRVIAVNSKDADGKPIQSHDLYKKNYRETAWFRALKAQQFTTTMPFSAPGNSTMTGTYIEDLHVDPDVKVAYPGDDGLTLGFSAPVYRDGKVVAYWTNRAKFSLVEDILRVTQQELKASGFPKASVVLLDQGGTILADYDPAEAGTDKIRHDFMTLMSVNLADRGLVAAKGAVAGKTGYDTDPHHQNGVLRMTGYTHLKGALGYPGMNWSVLVSVNHAGATANAVAINRNVLIALVVCLAIILPVGILIGRLGVRGILQVGQAAAKLSGGALDTRVQVTSTDEIGQLAQSFNSMAEQIQRNVAQQEAAHQALQAPLHDVQVVLSALAQGDLTPRMTGTYQPEFEEMQQNMNGAMEKLSETLSAVRESVEAVTLGYEQIIAGNDELAQRTTEQAAALEQTSSSMEEMTSTVKQSADSAIRTKQLAVESSAKAEDGSRLAAQVKASLGTVAASAQKVAGITKLIDDIAAQTNKLAVDAGASASRAGAQGRGFGIVAQEVRSLAQRSATAAREIKTLIEEFRAKLLDRGAGDDSRSDALQSDIVTSVNKIGDIAGVIDEIALQTNMLAINAAVEAAGAGAHGQNFAAVVTEIRDLATRSATAGREITDLVTVSLRHVEEGSSIAGQSVQTMQDIVQAATRVSQLVSQIASGSQEQATGIDQVNKAIMQIDQGTQQNAALVEETASASKLFMSQGQALMKQIRMFKLNVSEAQKAAMPSLMALRKDMASTIQTVYGKSELEATRDASDFGSNPNSQTAHHEKPEPVGAAAGNGKVHRSTEAEFEEF